MTRSASTPRLRLTLAYYVLLIVAAGVTEPVLMRGAKSALPWPTLTIVAAVLLVATACLGRIWCSVHIAGRKDAELVTSGPYALCRHPLYVLSLVGGIGIGLATQTITWTLVTVLALAVLFGRAARAEERVLTDIHGAAYAAYASATPRWWPRWSAWAIAPRLEVLPPVLWKSFVDAGSFFLVLVLVLLARAAGAAGWLPALLHLP